MQILCPRLCLRNTSVLNIVLARAFSNNIFPSSDVTSNKRTKNSIIINHQASHRKLSNKALKMKSTVGIVGGGISGLRCADILLQQGFKVTILEARNRLGGRMYQDTLPDGQVVDLGPNWIHGTDNNPILDLAKNTNTATHSWEDAADNIFEEQGNLVKNAAEISSTFWGTIMKAFQYSEKNSTTIDAEKSLWDFFLEKTAEMSKTAEGKENAKLLLQVAEMWGGFVGQHITRQSLKFFWLEECIDGENLFCAGTYQKILEVISKPAEKQAAIHFNTEVNAVNTDREKPILSTKDGKSLQFDEIVITAPLGWLKKNKAIFKPDLPARLSEAIDAIGYGNLEKVYITFPRAFWLGSKDKPHNQSPAGFTQWLHPSYAKPPARPDWNQEAVDLSTLPGESAHPTLLFYIYGTQGSLVANKWNDLTSPDQRTAWLAEYFKPYVERLAHYDTSSKDCVPSYCLATSWTTDALAGNGSYSNFPVGLREGDKDIEVMREGLPERNLWFAGEHTAPFVALGTVTGAYWSGEMVAKRIAEKHGKPAGDYNVLKGDDFIAKTRGGGGVNVRGFADDGAKTGGKSAS